jgi:hypothetical protein
VGALELLGREGGEPAFYKDDQRAVARHEVEVEASVAEQLKGLSVTSTPSGRSSYSGGWPVSAMLGSTVMKIVDAPIHAVTPIVPAESRIRFPE